VGWQLVALEGGAVAAPGLHPAYGAGHVAPRTPHAPDWQVWPCDVQFSQTAPYVPQFCAAVPGRQVPSGEQHPAQVSGPQ
jgi:hypothetical protein